MRYRVKNPDGEDLVCPSLADLHALYKQGFLEDDDLVRPENSQRWVRAGDLPALRGVRDSRRDPRRIAILAAAVIALAVALALLFRLRF